MRSPHRSGARLKPLESALSPGSVPTRPPPLDTSESFSISEPTRLTVPRSYNVPRRAPFQSAAVGEEKPGSKLFNKLKGLHRAPVTSTTVSSRRDFKMLASASRRSGDVHKAAIEYFRLAVVQDNAGQYAKAIDCYKQYLSALKETDDVQAKCIGYNALAISYQLAGQLQSALNCHAIHAKTAPDVRGRVIALCNAGLVQRHLDRIGDAVQCHQSALDLAVAAGDTAGEMLASGHLGLDATKAGVASTTHLERGRQAIERQIALQTAEDDPKNRSIAFQHLGLLAHAGGQFREAVDHFGKARMFSRQLKDKPRSDLDKCHIGISMAHQHMHSLFARIKDSFEVKEPPATAGAVLSGSRGRTMGGGGGGGRGRAASDPGSAE